MKQTLKLFYRFSKVVKKQLEFSNIASLTLKNKKKRFVDILINMISRSKKSIHWAPSVCYKISFKIRFLHFVKKPYKIGKIAPFTQKNDPFYPTFLVETSIRSKRTYRSQHFSLLQNKLINSFVFIIFAKLQRSNRELAKLFLWLIEIKIQFFLTFT